MIVNNFFNYLKIKAIKKEEEKGCLWKNYGRIWKVMKDSEGGGLEN